MRQPTTAWFTTYLKAARLLLVGRFDDAERLSTEALNLGRAAGHADAEMFSSCQRIQLAFERGGLGRWARPLRVAMTRHPESRWFLRSWQALAYCEADDIESARPIFEELAAKDFADFAFEPTWLHVVTNCAAVCATLRDRGRSQTLLALIEPYDGQFVTMSSLAYTGPVAYYLGLLAATLDRHEEATRHFAAAVAASERMGAPAWLARAQLAWSRALLDRNGPGDERAARAMLDEALATAVNLGLATVERRARALLPPS